jgi:hypothetical protein
MKLLRCKFCAGEMDIIGNERTINKKVKCRKCNFSNETELERKSPEVMFVRKRPPPDQNI